LHVAAETCTFTSAAYEIEKIGNKWLQQITENEDKTRNMNQ